MDEKVFVTSPLLPDLEKVMGELKDIWSSKWLTNMGEKHKLFENRLKDELKVRNASIFNNGTIALLVALKSLNLPYGSEVITTPFTFAATPHSIVWNGLQPVFCDIEEATMTIDASKIESLITPKTSAILGVHVYGYPCDVYKIESIAKKHNLKVIYDGAHVFSTEIDGRGIGSFGDITMFSFHATKLFNSIEGGCLTYNDDNLIKKIYNLRNFGIQSEEVIEDIGINGKMNEVQASIGLLNLELYREEQGKRKVLKDFYNAELSNIKGIRIPEMPANTTDSYQYYPIVFNDDYPYTRNEVYDKFKEKNIYTRKYFYPACTDYDCYKDMLLSKLSKLPVTDKVKNNVLCLPYHSGVSMEARQYIVDALKNCRW